MSQTLYIKNMVCNRCIMAVENELQHLAVPYKKVELGEVELEAPLTKNQEEALNTALDKLGFELLQGKQAKLIDKVKSVIIEAIHYSNKHPNINFSDYISDKVHHEYKYISSLFSAVEGITIEKFIILQKVEKVKELLFYDELTLKEIAYELGYSSVQHLSNQFKKITGLSPSEFKVLKNNNRKPLDKLT